MKDRERHHRLQQTATGGVERESTVDGPQSEQYSLAKILGIWAVAALPMGALAWSWLR